ncbi:hypothetical protein OH799_03305 [Nocardia sp. NBC_00881]|uniref:hypothetical protein n=1 Tax=Nocardia sp. NBC_00881 TaxID=2975995 RepID=UPI003869444E|nr:hypothetical protein OH799_03305 [Nocardia sp. NBC_00881]
MVALLAAVGSASLAVIAAHVTVVARSLAELRSPRREGAPDRAEQTSCTPTV